MPGANPLYPSLPTAYPPPTTSYPDAPGYPPQAGYPNPAPYPGSTQPGNAGGWNL